MDAQIKKLAITPAKFDKESEPVKDESATLTLDIPMDTLTAKKEVMALFEVLSQEFVTVEITNPQGRLDIG